MMKINILALSLLASLSLFACSSKTPETDTNTVQSNEQAQPSPIVEQSTRLIFDIQYTNTINQTMLVKADQIQNDLAKDKNIQITCKRNNKQMQLNCTFENEADVQQLDKIKLNMNGLSLISTTKNQVTLGYHDKFLKNIKDVSRIQTQSAISARLKAFGFENANVQVDKNNLLTIDIPNLEANQTLAIKSLITFPANFEIYTEAEKEIQTNVFESLKKQDLNKYNLSVQNDVIAANDVIDPTTKSIKTAGNNLLKSFIIEMEDLGLVPNGYKLLYSVMNGTWNLKLVKMHTDKINNEWISSAAGSVNKETQKPHAKLVLDANGKENLQRITKNNLNETIVIAIDDLDVSSSHVQTELSSGALTISTPMLTQNAEESARLVGIALSNPIPTQLIEHDEP